MPKDLFLKFPTEKQQKSLSVLETEFKTTPFQKVNVKEIVEKSGIARGSFCQYFENLEDAYFTILEKETVDIHALFMKIFVEKNKQLIPTLEEYGTQVADILFNEQTYMIYRNRCLYWSEDLNRSWEISKNQHAEDIHRFAERAGENFEKMQFIKAVVHSLIERMSLEEWTKEAFIANYKQHLNWIEKGVTYGTR